MTTRTLGRTIGDGALAGAVAGGIGAALQYWLVEPSIRAAIALEEAAAEATSNSHGAGESGAHSHGGEAVIGRSEQVLTGLVTVLIIGVLIGIAFALTHRFLGMRLPGRGVAGTTMSLAGLGFIALTLAPAVVVPANPPAVGDPDTVAYRTLVYLATIICAAALTAVVSGVARHRNLRPGQRYVAATMLGLIGAVLVVWALPNVTEAIPAAVPADLVWQFRTRSLAQVGAMWAVLAAVLAYLADDTRRDVRPRTTTPAYASVDV